MTKASLFNFLDDRIKSLKNYVKSSFFSLVVILITFLLLSQMEQAYTMMIDLVETSHFSLFLTFFFINAFALALSHYPIYNYYAADLNNSQDYTRWHHQKVLGIFPVLTFSIIPTEKKIDRWANYLRYLTGLVIHGIWIHFIIKSFSRNLVFEDFDPSLIRWLSYAVILIPFFLYTFFKKNFLSKPASQNQRLIRILGIGYAFILVLSVAGAILTPAFVTFSIFGFFLLLVTCYIHVFNYFLFRLLRPDFDQVIKSLKGPFLTPFRWVIRTVSATQSSVNYLLMFYTIFLIAFAVIAVSTVATLFERGLLNGLPILLAFFFAYYYAIASISKYLFAIKKIENPRLGLYRFLVAGIILLIILSAITMSGIFETRTHELDKVARSGYELSEEDFLEQIREKEDTVFFIASHGGGLKANVWTLNVLNQIQQKTEGRFLKQAIAMSGASGGSLGLGLYTALYYENQQDTKKIQAKIDSLARQNYTSMDLTLTFGLDTYRKLWPFSLLYQGRDRPYYAMRKYQNHVTGKKSQTLSEKSFREFWWQANSYEGNFPALIMNTASTKGSRGILWSVKTDHFQDIFPFAQNLADLNDHQTLSFYQAVSTTNRFPIFSPAAKIPGYGHFIDAGAIDNSGLLGCLDLYHYLLTQDSAVMRGKTAVFVEIINSKSLYTEYLYQQFLDNVLHQPHIRINENETDNIVADIKTGMNLDKIPGYLGDFMDRQEIVSKGKVRHVRVFMPHKILVSDVEGFLDGKITDDQIKSKLKSFLSEENQRILTLTEGCEKDSFESWCSYEPTLSRHLSKSSLNYIAKILAHPIVQEPFSLIQEITRQRKADPPLAAEMQPLLSSH